MKESIIVQRTAHFYIEKAKPEANTLLIVVHGYAQLAGEFIQQFNRLKSKKIDVLAPEALSKFYNKERKPVANWMTAYERETEIEDYLHYFSAIEKYILAHFPKHKIQVLGFSQGVSTVMRWLNQTNLIVNEVHLVAGSIPPELGSKQVNSIKAKNWFYYYGDKDKLLTPPQAEKQISIVESFFANPTIVKFNGRHEVPEEFFERVNSTDQ